MTNYFDDNFTGSNGAAWDTGKWTNSATSTTGSSAQIQGNKGRLNAGTNTGYTGKKGMRHLTTYIDSEIYFTFQYANTGDGAVYAHLRSDANADGASHYYFFVDKSGTAKIGKNVSFADTSLTTMSFTITQGPIYAVKFYNVGTNLKAKIWDTSGGEPGSYQLITTDSSITGAGYAVLKVAGGNAGGFIADFDDVLLTDGQGNQFTYTGAVTSAGALSRKSIKILVATVTPAGVLIKVKVVTKLLTGAVASAGVFLKRAIKRPTGAISPTGALTKAMPKTMTGAITSAGTYRKAFVRKYAGTIASAGSLTTTWLGRVFGRPGIVRMTVRAAGWVGVRVRRG